MNSKFNQITDKLNLIKSELATAVSNKGVPTSPDASFETIETHINLIEKNGAGGEIKLEGEEIFLDTSEPIKKGTIVGVHGELEEEIVYENFYSKVIPTLPYYFSLPFTSEGNRMLLMGTSSQPSMRVYCIGDDLSKATEYSVVSNGLNFSSSVYIKQIKLDPTADTLRGIAQITTSTLSDIYAAFDFTIDHEAKTLTLTRIPIVSDSFKPEARATGMFVNNMGKVYLTGYVSTKIGQIHEFEYRDGQYVETGEIIPYTIYGSSIYYQINDILNVTDDTIYANTGYSATKCIISKGIGGEWSTFFLNSNLNEDEYLYYGNSIFIANDRVYSSASNKNGLHDITDAHRGNVVKFGPIISILSSNFFMVNNRFIVTYIPAASTYTSTFQKSGVYVIDLDKKGFFRSTALSNKYLNLATQAGTSSWGDGYFLISKKKTGSTSITYDLCRFNVKLTAELPTQENKERRMYTGYALEDSKDGKVKIVMINK